MRKQWVVVGILTGTLMAGGNALAQHKTPKQQPTTAEVPTAPTGEVALGSVRLAKGLTADGKALAAGTYQVRVTAQEAKPETVGQTEPLERWAEFMQKGEVRGTRSRHHRAERRSQGSREGSAAPLRRLQGREPGRGGLRARVDQPSQQSLPDLSADRLGRHQVSRSSVVSGDSNRCCPLFHVAITSNCS